MSSGEIADVADAVIREQRKRITQLEAALREAGKDTERLDVLEWLIRNDHIPTTLEPVPTGNLRLHGRVPGRVRENGKRYILDVITVESSNIREAIDGAREAIAKETKP